LDEIGSVVYEEMSFKAKVYGRTDGRRTDGRRTKSDHKSSPCHFVTGELKTYRKFSVQYFVILTNYDIKGVKLINYRQLLINSGFDTN
jgi:hypothetical protein